MMSPMTSPEEIMSALAEAVGSDLVDALAGESGVHLVGGAVRDLLRGAPPRDLDIVVEGDAIALAGRLAARAHGSVVGHDRFGTASVLAAGRRVDLAGARAERYPRPGALPEVRPAGLREDLARRDFTVHAIALTLGPPDPGRVTAVACAHADLAARRLRVLHEESFRDDPTRLLRLARYGARLGFEAEPHTLALAAAAAEEGALDTLTGPRIGAELRLSAHEPDPLAALAALAPLGLDRAIHPALGLDRALAERALALLVSARRATDDSGNSGDSGGAGGADDSGDSSDSGGAGDSGGPDGRGGPDDHDLAERAAVALACLAGGLWADAGELLTRLGFSAAEQRVPRALAGGELGRLARALEPAPAASAILSALTGRSPAEAALVGALGADTAARYWLERLRHVRLAIDGATLLAAGVPEGPAVGHALRAALAAKADGRIGSPAAELAAAVAAAARFAAGAERDARGP